jgi:hypothetical protein
MDIAYDKIKFNKALVWTGHSSSVRSHNIFKDRTDFVAYRDMFEQCFCKIALLRGDFGDVEMRPLIPPYEPNLKLDTLLANNSWAIDRIKSGKNLFGIIRKGGKLQDTEYYKTFMSAGAKHNSVQRKFNRVRKIYNRVRKANKFIGQNPHQWSGHDFPQVIDYWGYQKNLDGTHRRMVMYALNYDECPCLVLNVDDVSKSALKGLPSLLYDKWHWFVDKIAEAKGETMDKSKQVRSLSGEKGWYQWIDLGDGTTTKAKTHHRAKRRTISLVKWIQKLVDVDDVVLDIGCNAGIHSLIAGEICKRVQGVEVVKSYVKQANWVKEEWERKIGRDLSHVTFHTLDINKRLELLNDKTFLIASKVLYHKAFRAGIPAFMKAVKKSPIKTILVQGHTTRGSLGQISGMKSLLQNHGFSFELLEDVEEYPIAVGTR